MLTALSRCYNDSNITRAIKLYEVWQRPESYFNTPEQFSLANIQSYLYELCSMALPKI
jgi:hypothetical protein